MCSYFAKEMRLAHKRSVEHGKNFPLLLSAASNMEKIFLGCFKGIGAIGDQSACAIMT